LKVFHCRHGRTIRITMIALFAWLFGSAHAIDVTGESTSETAARIKGDRAVITALADAKSNLSKPHEIEFHFVGYSESKLSALAEEGKSLSYRVSKIDSLVDKGGRPYWFFDLIRDIVPTEKNIVSHTAIMAALARKHGAEYDGWGCQVVQ
jgi:regulator of RNase E activity RraB